MEKLSLEEQAMMAQAKRTMQLVADFASVDRATAFPDGRPESDTDHTVALGVVACMFCPGLDVGRVAEFALVHDLVEAELKADTDTFKITAEGRAAKRAREVRALGVIVARFGADSWISRTLQLYEAQEIPEARYVYVMDKAMPKLLHALNGCATLRAKGHELADMVRAHDTQCRDLAQRYFTDQPEALRFLRASCRLAEQAWNEFVPVDSARWTAARTAEDPGTTHPCDTADPSRCSCKGACSCHWVRR